MVRGLGLGVQVSKQKGKKVNREIMYKMLELKVQKTI